MEGFIELWRPVVALGLCREFAFLVTQMRADHVHLNESTEHVGSSPFQIIRSNNYYNKKIKLQ